MVQITDCLLSGLRGGSSASNPAERSMNGSRLEINVGALLGILTTPPSLLLHDNSVPRGAEDSAGVCSKVC